MMSTTPLKIVFMGNIQTNKKIAEHQSCSITNHSDIKKVFDRMCQMFTGQLDQRTKLGAPQGNCIYLTVLNPNIFYLAMVETSFPERNVFALFEELHKENVYTYINENNELNPTGKSMLKEIIDKYQDQSNCGNISSIQNDLNDIKAEARKNISKTMNNIDDISDLETQSNRIKKDALVYNENAKDLKKVSFWQNFKWTLIIAGTLLLLVLIIVLLVAT